MQAESLGWNKAINNNQKRNPLDDCILFYSRNNAWQDDTHYAAKTIGLNEILLDAKEYDKAETNCGGCMGPCGECENKQVPTIDQDVLHSLMEYQFMFQKSQYTKTESEDGTITLKPKRYYVIVVFYKAKEGKKVITKTWNNRNEYKFGIEEIVLKGGRILETIEREYEI